MTARAPAPVPVEVGMTVSINRGTVVTIGKVVKANKRTVRVSIRDNGVARVVLIPRAMIRAAWWRTNA